MLIPFVSLLSLPSLSCLKLSLPAFDINFTFNYWNWIREFVNLQVGEYVLMPRSFPFGSRLSPESLKWIENKAFMRTSLPLKADNYK